MKDIDKTEVTLYSFKPEKLDLINFIIQDFPNNKFNNHGMKINIDCHGKAWVAYFGSIGSKTPEEFFLGCDEYYLADKLSSVDSTVYDLEKIQEEAGKKGICVNRDDPWHDYGFLSEMYGSHPFNWPDKLPTKPNPKYEYLCSIIKAVQSALKALEK